METLAEQPREHQSYEQLNRYERVRNDTITWLAESLHGSMRTPPVEAYFDGEELYGADDDGAFKEIFDDALTHARMITEHNPSLSFELRRRLIDYGEYEDMLAMARDELPNTMVVVSDFPVELTGKNEDVIGYNTQRRQTMLRVITKQPDGRLDIVTQSLDGSNRQALEAIYARLGVVPTEGELLGQRHHVDLSPAEQTGLTDELTDCYDNSLSEQFGGEWHAGIQQTAERQIVDTYHFAYSQDDLIEWFVQAKLADPVGAEKLRYKLAATVSQRYEALAAQSLNDDLHVMEAQAVLYPPPQTLYQEIEQATNQALANRRTFSGCGISAEEQQTHLQDQLKTSGYGNQSEDDCEFISKKCPECGDKNVKTKVTKTHISGSCGCVKKR